METTENCIHLRKKINTFCVGTIPQSKIEAECQLKKDSDTKLFPQMVEALHKLGSFDLPTNECKFFYLGKMEKCPFKKNDKYM